MKKNNLLFGLLLVWLGLTIKLGINNLSLTQSFEDQIHIRALMYYIGSKDGCMVGAEYANGFYSPIKMYPQCVSYALDIKYVYLKKWLPEQYR